MTSPTVPADLAAQLETHRVELTAYCYRVLGAAFEAEDAVQETFLRAGGGGVRGPLRAPDVAVPHRDQRLPGHAAGTPTTRSAHRSGRGGGYWRRWIP